MSFPSDETPEANEIARPQQPEAHEAPAEPAHEAPPFQPAGLTPASPSGAIPGSTAASSNLPEDRPGEPGVLVPATAGGEPWIDEAALEAARAEEAERRSRRSRRLAMELVQTLVLALLIFFAVRTMAQNFKVEGSSMEPGLHDGQYLLVNKAVYFKINLRTIARVLPFIHVGDNASRYLFHGPHRGDVIVFRYPNDPSRDFIKRVIGVPGDTVEINNGTLLINNKPIPEDYLESGVQGSTYAKQTVPEGKYFVLGDNRNNSSDSRAWGFVPQENIIGQAMLSYWPLDTLGGVGNRHISLGSIGLPVSIPVPVPF